MDKGKCPKTTTYRIRGSIANRFNRVLYLDLQLE
jgi:hypothetical protein